jgi:hypothetical protein
LKVDVSGYFKKGLKMKVKTMIEWLQELPPDYDMVISEYFCYVGDDSTDVYFCVVDDPIAGFARNDENKELRLFVQRSEEQALKEIERKSYWRRLDEE